MKLEPCFQTRRHEIWPQVLWSWNMTPSATPYHAMSSFFRVFVRGSVQIFFSRSTDPCFCVLRNLLSSYPTVGHMMSHICYSSWWRHWLKGKKGFDESHLKPKGSVFVWISRRRSESYWWLIGLDDVTVFEWGIMSHFLSTTAYTILRGRLFCHILLNRSISHVPLPVQHFLWVIAMMTLYGDS